MSLTLVISYTPERVGVREQSGRIGLERDCNGVNIIQADVAFTPLDAADVGTMKFSAIRQLLLRNSESVAQVSHSCAECHSLLDFVRYHRWNDGRNVDYWSTDNK